MKGPPHPLKKEKDIYRIYTTYIYSYIPKEKEKKKKLPIPPPPKKCFFEGCFLIFAEVAKFSSSSAPTRTYTLTHIHARVKIK